MFASTSRRFPLVEQLVLTLAGCFFAAPLVYTVAISLENHGFENYRAVLEHHHFFRFVLNSLIVAVATSAIVYVVTCLAAYAFSRLRLRFGGVLLGLVLLGLMVPPAAIMLPLFIEVRNLGLLNTYPALIGPYTALIVPLTVLLMRNFMDTLPVELVDASRIDGCSRAQTLRYVILPLLRPVTGVVLVWSFLSCWNEYFFALVFMQDVPRQLVTQAPQFFVGEYFQDTPKVFASLVLISIPIIGIYFGVQRRFVQGLTAGAVK
jgi:raffinose/stachyose/melibiose transport system permease protein